MNIKLEQYRIFKACAEAKSFSEAAKTLFITQSAVSQQIQALEKEIGAPLFVRLHNKGVALTTQGTLLLGFVKESLGILENAESLFSRMQALSEGELRIGAGDTITRHYLLPLLEKFHRLYPGVKIEIVNRVTNKTLAKLITGKIDIAFVNLPVDSPTCTGVETLPVKPLHDIFIAGPAFAHLRGKPLTEAGVSALPLVMLEPRSNSRTAVDRYFQQKGIRLTPEFELGSHDLLFDFARRGLGIACVTAEFAGDILNKDGVFALDTSFALPERSIGVCTLSGVAPTPAVMKLMEMIAQDMA